MSKAMVVQYQTRPDAADENQRLIEQVFAELNAGDPGGLQYASFRLADGVTFVHVAIKDGDIDPLDTSAAFKAFAADIGQRVAGPPQRQEATMIGSYRLA